VALPLSKHSIKQQVATSEKYLSLILTRSEETDPVTGLYKMLDVQVDDKDAKDKNGNALRFHFDNDEQRNQLIGFIKANVDHLMADKRVFIKADAELPFHYVNELFQICREAGADEASIVTAEDKSGKD
jgi:biopolymer transport protein ExbD